MGLLPDGAANGEGGGAGGDGPDACDRVTGIGGSGYLDLSGDGSKGTGGAVIGVVGRIAPGRAVVGDREIVQDGREGVGHGHIIGSDGSGVARILNHEGVGDDIIFGDRGGADRLVDGERGTAQGTQGLGCRQGRGQSAACDRDGVGNASVHGGVGKIIGGGAVDYNDVASRGDGDAADAQGGPCRDGRRCLKNSVLIIGDRVGHIVQGRVGRALCRGVGTQVIGQGQARDRRGACVGQTDHISDRVAGTVALRDGILLDVKNLQKLSADDVRACHRIVVGQSCLIIKYSHAVSPFINGMMRAFALLPLYSADFVGVPYNANGRCFFGQC